MRCDNDSGGRHVRHGHGNVNKAETGDSRAAMGMTGIVMLYYTGTTCYLMVALQSTWSADCEAMCHDPCTFSIPS